MSTLERFLAYSLRWQRPIKVILMDESGTRSQNITVQGYDGQTLHYLSARSKKLPRSLPLDAVLSASYARGDEGDSLKNREKEKQDDQ
ncbi:MAG: hypothetical protein AB9880_06090 [Christensenellales bacterium]